MRARTWPSRHRWIGLLGLAITGCRLSGGEACTVRSGDPLITLATVKDSASGAPIPDVTVSGVQFEGSPVTNMEFLVNPDRGPTSQVTLDAQTLRCHIACGFASSVGKYRFLLGAQGYRTREIIVDARYAETSSGCPTLLRRGLSLNEILSKS